MPASSNKHIRLETGTQPAYSTTDCWNAAIAQGWSVACWRLPNTAEKHFIAHERPEWRKPVLEELPKGFLAMPFFPEKGDQALFIEAQWHYCWETPQEAGYWRSAVPAFIKQEEETRQGHSIAMPLEEGATDYQDLVAKGVDAIERGFFQKVVLSRRKAVPLPQGAHALSVFERLCQLYPNAFVSLVSNPEVGTWVGASPEILVNANKAGIFRTIALAGTQARANFDKLADATWRQKEIEEQAMVSRYIINCFKQIRLREFEEIGPRTVQAGSLIHLRTDFVVDTRATNFPELGTVMLELLHPTSAVCGMPKTEAMAFIEAFEGYNRRLYSGYLGPVGISDETNLFVNLRCLQLNGNEAWLYAGAGITQDSDPAREFQETELKMGVVAKGLLAE